MQKPRKLIWRLFPSYLLIMLLSVFAVSWYATSSLHEFFIHQTAQDLFSRARLFENQITRFLSPMDESAVDRLCKQAGRTSNTRFTVILSGGRVIGDSRDTPQHMENHAGRPEIVDALAGGSGQAIRYSRTLMQRMMYVAYSLVAEGQPMAVVRASVPVTSLDDAFISLRIQIAVAGLLIALVATGISLLVSRRYSRLLEQMTKGASRFAQGELDHRLPLPDSEELAQLADAMNRMAAQLDNRIKTILNQRRELETVLSSMLEGVIAIDNEERIISMNQAAAQWLGKEPARLRGRSMQEVIRNLALQQFIARALLSGQPLEDDITVFQNGERVLNVRSSPLLDADHQRIGTLVVFNDVTRLRRLENVRRDFVANVSHEIKTPLTAIKGFVETLHQGLVDNPREVQRFLEIIKKHVDRLNSIIVDLLSLSRVEQESDGQTLNTEAVGVLEIFQAALQICRAKADEKQIRIDVVCPSDLNAELDPTLLEQAVVNLLDNAIKYSGADRTIRLEAEKIDDRLVIAVHDHGIGIAQKHLPRLFERFYRVDKARSRKMGGTGLGLAIVKHIAQAHGGSVSVDSLLGKGSTFRIIIPFQPEPPEGGRAPDTPRGGSQTG